MKYNIIKLIAPVNNSLHLSFFESTLLNSVEEVKEYLKDEEEMYRGSRDVVINFTNPYCLTSTDYDEVTTNQRETIYTIENEHVLAKYYCKLEDVDCFRKEWDRDVNKDNKPCFSALHDFGYHWMIDKYYESGYIASFDGNDYVWIDIRLREIPEKLFMSEFVKLRLFLSVPRSYKHCKVIHSMEALRNYVEERMSDVETLLSITISPTKLIFRDNQTIKTKVFEFKSIKFKSYKEE